MGSHGSLLQALRNMRWLAVAGQAAAVLVATGPMGIDLSVPLLWLGIAVLTLFNIYAHWRTRRPEAASATEGVVHLGVDIAELAWMIAFSGGIMNPFASLFLLPIAFAAVALSPARVWLVAAMSISGYALSVLLARHVPTHSEGHFDLHLWGMALNLLLSVAVLMSFFLRMNQALRRRERELAGLHEKFARNEGIVALATHAASVAHELNTPLASMTLLLDDLLEDGPSSAPHAEHQNLRTLVDTCRDRVRQLAAPADASTDRHVRLERVIDQWQLVRPTVRLQRHLDADLPRVDAAVGHLLLALLNNAADASELAGSAHVELSITKVAGGLRGEVRDHGPGIDPDRPLLPGRLFNSPAGAGLGIGLALSHATVEQRGGTLSMTPAATGTRVRFELPTPSVQDARGDP